MALFIAVAALLIGSVNMSFKQGQANPDAPTFFQSKSERFVDPYSDR